MSDDALGHLPVAERSKVNYGRKMLAKEHEDRIRIVKAIPSGEDTFGCIACCHAPSCCALMSLCPCCTNPEYIIHKRASSKYIYIRENSIEWNDPEIVLRNGACFGCDPCVYDIEDHITVMYFDNPLFSRMTDQTRVCNECRTCVCGGRGERIQIDSPCCCGFCLRSKFPCPCLPICCPSIYFPCAKRHTLFVDDAQMAMHEIKKAMDEVKAFHAVDRHSEPLVSADVVAGAVKGMQMENRGRSTTRSRRDMGGSRSPARSRSPNRI